MDYSIVIPLHNEEGSLRELYRQLKDVMDGLGGSYEILFIDDASRDGTLAILHELQASDPHLKVVQFRRQFGQTAGWAAGFDYAIGNYVVTMDGDLQNDPRDIPLMLKHLQENGHDVVSGWRKNRKDEGWLKLSSRVGNAIHRYVTGEKIHDHGCSLKIYKKEALEELELYSEMRRYITALLSWKGFEVGEMIVRHHPRRHGRTKYNFRKKIKAFLDLLVVKFWIQYSARPVHFFGAIGIAFIIIGFLLGGSLGILWLFRLISLADRSSPLLAVLLVLLGFQFLLSGVLADVVSRTYYSTRKTYAVKALAGFDETITD